MKCLIWQQIQILLGMNCSAFETEHFLIVLVTDLKKINYFFTFFSVEQVKGSDEMKEKIIKASKQARFSCSQDLLPDYQTNIIVDKYLNNYNEPQVQSNGKWFSLFECFV